MAKKRREGTCHICGCYGPLSFEHIPPHAAFNDRPVIRVEFEQAMSLGPDEQAKGPKQQKGMGGYTLCARCNNNTGAWYGNQFVSWCYQGMDMLVRTNGKPTLIYLNYIFPLQVLKQIVTMFFSVTHEGFRKPHEELVRFVLNPEKRYLSPKYRFFVYYNITGNLRTSGIVAAMNLGKSRKPTVMSEITFPPFGYLMTIDSEPPDERLIEITHFARYDYNQFVVMPLQLPVLPTHTLIPGDYRDKKQIQKDFAANVLAAANEGQV